MAAFANGVSRVLGKVNINPVLKFLGPSVVLVNSSRNIGFFKHLSLNNEHNKDDYQFEVSSDPKEWEYVKDLLPLTTVPEPSEKPIYPSGWRPVKKEAFQHPYFVERTKNHMLPVFLKKYGVANTLCTKVKNVHGDLRGFQKDLHNHIEMKIGRRVPCYVHEGNCTIFFRGDFVYYVEQWLLSKGF